MTQHTETAYIVVDIWRARPGQQAQLDRLLADSAVAFRQRPGVLSVDFTRLEGEPERYLVVFRYRDAQAREDFVATPELKATLSALSEFWDLESPIYKGIPLEH